MLIRYGSHLKRGANRWPRAFWFAYLLGISLIAGVVSVGAVEGDPPSEKDASVAAVASVESAAIVTASVADTSTLLYPLPADRTPNDGDETNDGGWLLVDFCTAGATGNRPAETPDCHHNDDDSAQYALGFTFDLYEAPFIDVYVNNNGNLSFGELFPTFSPFGFPVLGFPMVAPFWGDVDTGSQSNNASAGHVWYQEFGSNTFVVTWDNVGYYAVNDDKKNTFQVAISDGTNELMGLGANVCFSYGDMQWTTGDASGGSGGLGGSPATVGVNRGDGVDFALIGRFDHEGTDYDGPAGSADGVSWLDGQNFCFNASGENIPPIPQGFPSGTVTTFAGALLDLDLAFSSPEFDQTTTVAINDLNGAQAAGLSIVNTPGNLATLDLTWTPDNADAGIYVLEFTATDSYSPPGETTESLTIEVIGANQPPTADPNGPYSGDEGSAIPLDGTGSSDPDSDPLTYSWDVGSALCSFDDSTSATPNLTCTDNGSFTVELEVDDGQGATDSDTAEVTVNNVPPTVTIDSYPTDPVAAGSPAAVAFSFTDPGTNDTHTATCTWDGLPSDDLGAVTSPSSCTRSDLDPGLYTVTVEVTDDDGGVGTAVTDLMIVIYDPSAGFVTGGGWIYSQPGAYYPQDNYDGSYYRLFEAAGITWAEAYDLVAAMTNDSCASVHLATVTSAEEDAFIVDTFGEAALNGKWLGGFQADTATAVEEGWQWVTGEDWLYTNWNGGEPNDAPYPENGDEQHLTYWNNGMWNDEGYLGNVTGYLVEYDDCYSGKANFGFVSKYKKGANVPTGSTEFQFHAGDLNFHSNTYDWLVVTGSDFAKFKGAGTINGEMDPNGDMYKFQIWAGDDDPDTFRIKIWYEIDDVEYVVYDNGFDQELGGGSIVIHTKK